MLYEIWAFITGQEIVWLKDYDGELTKTFAKKTPFGYVAKRWWPFNIRNVVCLPDGSTTGVPYVHYWKFDKD